MLDKSILEGKVISELQTIADSLGLEGHQRMRKGELIQAIVDRASQDGAAGDGDGQPQASASGPGSSSTDGGVATEVETAERSESPNGETATPAQAETGEPAAADGAAASVDTDTDTGERREPREQQQREPREQRGPSDDGDNRPGGPRNRRPTRDERRRQREERRQREMEQREQELAEAPVRTGILDILPEGYGFLRTSGYLPGPTDVYVSLSQVRRFALRKGDTVTGAIRQPKDNEKYFALLRIDNVNGMDPEEAKQRPVFEKLTPLFPDQRVRLEHSPTGVSERIIDLIAPIGKGQRGMVVSPPKAGKTTVLKQIANGFLSADPDIHLIVLLVDERPEEVTDWQRTVEAAEVVYSTFDKPPDQHIQVTELVLERAKRLAEMGQDVAILLDSITRLARAYNLAAPASGKILSGGIDSTALYPPRRFFGAARNIEEGGSLTIIASTLVETGSRMDEGIFEEFKGTGNWEIRLDRGLSEKRIFPAINVEASSTRKEELLMSNEELALVWRLRRVLHALDPGASLELLIDKIRATKSNEQFLKEIAKAPVS
jgi:transcription termination factor Rho